MARWALTVTGGDGTRVSQTGDNPLDHSAGSNILKRGQTRRVKVKEVIPKIQKHRRSKRVAKDNQFLAVIQKLSLPKAEAKNKAVQKGERTENA